MVTEKSVAESSRWAYAFGVPPDDRTLAYVAAARRWSATFSTPLLSLEMRTRIEHDFIEMAIVRSELAEVTLAGTTYNMANVLPLDDPWRRHIPSEWSEALDVREGGGPPDVLSETADLFEPLDERASSLIAAAFDGFEPARSAVRGLLVPGQITEGVEVATQAIRWLIFRWRSYTVDMWEAWPTQSIWFFAGIARSMVESGETSVIENDADILANRLPTGLRDQDF